MKKSLILYFLLCTVLALSFTLFSCSNEKEDETLRVESNDDGRPDAAKIFGYAQLGQLESLVHDVDKKPSYITIYYPAGWKIDFWRKSVSSGKISYSINPVPKSDIDYMDLSEAAEACWDTESVAYRGHIVYSVPVGSKGTGLMYIWDETDVAQNRILDGDSNWLAMVCFEDSEYYYIVYWSLRDGSQAELLESIPTFISLLKKIENIQGRDFF